MLKFLNLDESHHPHLCENKMAVSLALSQHYQRITDNVFTFTCPEFLNNVVVLCCPNNHFNSRQFSQPSNIQYHTVAILSHTHSVQISIITYESDIQFKGTICSSTTVLHLHCLLHTLFLQASPHPALERQRKVEKHISQRNTTFSKVNILILGNQVNYNCHLSLFLAFKT